MKYAALRVKFEHEQKIAQNYCFFPVLPLLTKSSKEIALLGVSAKCLVEAEWIRPVLELKDKNNEKNFET